MEYREITQYLLPLPSSQVPPFLQSHAETANYLATPEKPGFSGPGSKDQEFSDNESLWLAVIGERLRRTDVKVILRGFSILEWFPRSPGLFHLEDAKLNRQEAMRHIGKEIDGVSVFTPSGKASMLAGGIGSIRLKPVNLDNETLCFMCASSTPISHEGFPIALPVDLRDKYIDEITMRGAVECTIIGSLRFIPDSFITLYSGYKHVPQVYLKVEEIIPTNTLGASNWLESNMDGMGQSIRPFYFGDPEKEKAWVSVAVSFVSSFEGSKRVYATYVTIPPANKEVFDAAVSWLEDRYVTGTYNGTVITDFDQQRSNFANAPFSLEKVMKLSLTEADLAPYEELLHVNVNQFINNQQNILFYSEEHMESKYKVEAENIGVVGDNTRVEHMTQVSSKTATVPVNFADQIAFLVEQLKIDLRNKEEAGENADEHYEAISIASKAKKALDEGDDARAKGYLASAGSWLLDFGSKIGVSLITAVIKQQTGLG